MAQRPLQIRYWPGVAAALCVTTLIGLSLLAVLSRAEFASGLAPSDWAAIRFTVAQAAVSAAVSVALATPLARALARQRFFGRALVITLLGAPFLLPVIVAVMGLLAIFGRGGWLNAILTALNMEPVSIYGFHGVVLAHVFFNLPLATRLLLLGWQDIPAEHFRLAAQLRLSRWSMFRIIEAPMLTRAVPGAAGLIFVICLTSFAVALIVGGGPRATTIELAIYQAFRFDFDLGRAAFLAVVQLGLAFSVGVVLLRLLPDYQPGLGVDHSQQRWDGAWWDAPIIVLGCLALILPMLSIMAQGLSGLTDLPPSIWQAAGRSVMVAFGSALLLLALSLPMAAWIARVGGIEAIGLLGLAMSPLMLGTGLFILLYPVADPASLALWITGLVNAVMALPFALRVLVPALRDIASQYGALAELLGLRGASLWRIVILPRLRRPLGFALGLGAALSMGDLGVVTLFSNPSQGTLPLQISQLQAAYRVETAAGASLLLTALSFAAFALLDGWGRRGHA